MSLGLLVLLAVEGLLRLGNWGTPDPAEDPFAGFANVRPLFALSEDGSHYEIAENRRDWFYNVQFDAEKGPDTYRIFCIGGSTVAGRPYTVETAFSTFLQVMVRQLDPDRNWEVINCGGISYASYRLVPIVEEVLANYEPDLLIVYTGHNEFLEDRTYEHLKGLPTAVTKPYELASHLRLFNVIRQSYLGLTGKGTASIMDARAILPEEVDALLEHQGGMEHYYRDDAWHQRVMEHFELNLDRMCVLAENVGVPLLFMNPSCNLRDTPPFKSEHRADLTDRERKEVEELLGAASKAFAESEIERAIALCDQAIGVDPLYALSHYRRAKLLDVLRRWDEAYDAYVKAKDLDVCPLRMLEPMHTILKEVVDRHGMPWVDVHGETLKNFETGIPGKDGFLDHVHPTIGGHQFFASLLVEKLAEMGVIPPLDDTWQQRVMPGLQAHGRTITRAYLADGEMRLENLRHWAEGKSEAEPPVASKRKRPGQESD